jgi:hypothetical protein
VRRATSHVARPKDYGGKHWDQLAEAKKKATIAKVAAA